MLSVVWREQDEPYRPCPNPRGGRREGRSVVFGIFMAGIGDSNAPFLIRNQGADLDWAKIRIENWI